MAGDQPKADKSSQAHAHADWLVNKLTTAQLIEKYPCNKDTASKWINKWEKEEITRIYNKSHFSITVTDDTLEKHASNVRFLASELDLAASEVQSCAKGSKERKDALTAFLRLEKRWSELTGIEAKIASNKAGEVEAAKFSVQQSKIPPSKREEQPRRISGPVVPLD